MRRPSRFDLTRHVRAENPEPSGPLQGILRGALGGQPDELRDALLRRGRAAGDQILLVRADLDFDAVPALGLCCLVHVAVLQRSVGRTSRGPCTVATDCYAGLWSAKGS